VLSGWSINVGLILRLKIPASLKQPQRGEIVAEKIILSHRSLSVEPQA